jgi:hypothetical protein
MTLHLDRTGEDARMRMMAARLKLKVKVSCSICSDQPGLALGLELGLDRVVGFSGRLGRRLGIIVMRRRETLGTSGNCQFSSSMTHCLSRRTVQIASLVMKAPSSSESSARRAGSIRKGVPPWSKDITVMMKICRSVVVGVNGLRKEEARVVVNLVELTPEAEVTRNTFKVDISKRNPDDI